MTVVQACIALGGWPFVAIVVVPWLVFGGLHLVGRALEREP